MLLSSAVRDFSKFFADNYSEFGAAANIDIVGSGVYHILFIGSVFGLVIGILLICINLMIGSPSTKAESKKRLTWTLVLGTLLFSVGVIVQIVLNISTSIKW